MSESGKRFGGLESEFGHDFETLSHRLKDAYQQLDALAHANNSQHSEQEELYMAVLLDGEVRAVFCTVDEYEWMRVRTQDSQGDQAHEYRSSLKTERKYKGGKHRAGGDPVNQEAARRGSLPQIDTMIVMAGILETCYQDLITNEDSVILAYEK